MITYPQFLEKLVLGHIKESFWLAKGKQATGGLHFNEKDFRFFSQGVSKLSEVFTQERHRLAANYLNDPICRSGYLLYFLPVNAAKIMAILDDLGTSSFKAGDLKVLDLGSGPGTSMLALMTFFGKQRRKIHFDLLDQSKRALDDAAFFHKAYTAQLHKTNSGFDSTLHLHNGDLRDKNVLRGLHQSKYDLIVLSNVINEIQPLAQREELLTLLANHYLTPQGKILIMEPALRHTSRDLQWLRDRLVLEGGPCVVLAPCLHQQTCPLNLFNKRDWCHFYLPWETPVFIEKVDRLVGRNKEWLNCSYLVLEKKGEKAPVASPHRWRMISNLMFTKGKGEAVFCNHQGRAHVTRLDKNSSSANEDFRSLRRGDVVEWASPFDRESYNVRLEGMIEKNTPLKVVRSWMGKRGGKI